MNRLGIVLALAVASLGSVACAASSEGDEDGATQTEDKLQIGMQQGLSCRRSPTDSCVTLQTYCERHGGHLECTLDGACTCVYSSATLFAQ